MGPRKILLLSDDSPIFPVLHQVFTAAGYQVSTARNSQCALEAIRRDDFRLLITRMAPNGARIFPVLRSLRKKSSRSVAILLKGEHEVNSPLEAYQVQGNEEVFIPCGWAGLRRLVAHCLNG